MNDTFEDIAQDAVAALTAVIIALRVIGENEIARVVAKSAEELCDRAIALGGE